MPLKNPAYLGEVKVQNQPNQQIFPSIKGDVAANAKAATATLTVSDLNTNITNTGASGGIVLTLPVASLCKSSMIHVQLTVAQTVQLDPNGTESVYLGGSGVAGKYLQMAGVIGNFVELFCDGTKWLVTNYSGVATKEA